MKKILILLIILFCLPLLGRAQEVVTDSLLTQFTPYLGLQPLTGRDQYNYVISRELKSADGGKYADVIQFYDGLGRKSLRAESKLQSYLLTQQEYDALGRPYKAWLPVDGVAEYADRATVTTRAAQCYNQDARPFSQTTYEDSPLSRIATEHGPGADWADYPRCMDYLTNDTTTAELICQNYLCYMGSFRAYGKCLPGELAVERSADEDGHVTLTFTNKEGRMLLSRQVNGSQLHDTYYVYDLQGRLRYVLPPMVQDDLSAASLEKYAYRYTYDQWNRCTEKKLPGADSLIHYVYDRADRLIFQQDGEQRKRSEWTLMLYDGLGREVIRGRCTLSEPPQLDSLVVKATRSTGAGFQNTGYVVSGLTLANCTLQQVNYYDNYTMSLQLSPTNARHLLYGFADVSGSSNYGQRYVKTSIPEISAQGLLTGQCIYREGGQDYTVVAYYYDAQGNVVQRRVLNHLGGYEKDFYAYTFSGKLSKHLHVHNTDSGTQLREVYTYEYDSNTGSNPERLLRVTHKLNDGAEVTLAEYEYDWLDRRSSRLLHDSLYQESYAYNIRDWLTGISGTKFTQSLTYGNGTAGYNGNITATAWTANGSSHSYAFAYDGLNRLTSATHGAGRFTEKVTSYDKNGNILALQRYGQTAASAYGLIDNLTLTYDGNRLTRADDAVAASAYGGGFEFKDAVKQTNEYTYDANGNLTKDLNKNISSIQYNSLNLPSIVTFGDGSTITYTYTADGTKLRTVHQIGGTTTTTDYCGDVIYENGVRKLLLTEAGYITLADNQYHYYLQDHQGNNRVVLNQSGTVEEVNHYYPFGGVFASTGNVQPYKYNGKEYDNKLGLKWYDYGARHYDVALGRFLTVDPMAENMHSANQYTYCLNNPLNYIDPLGADTIDVKNVDWSNFNVDQDVIALNEVSIMEYAPWQITENNGIYYYQNVFTGARRGAIGEQGLINKDCLLFNLLAAGRMFFTGLFSPRTISYQFATKTRLPTLAVTKGTNYVMRNQSKIVHIFGKSQHKLAPLVSQLGNYEKVIRSTLIALENSGKLPLSGIFECSVEVGGYNVVVRGFVQDGIPKIATMFIP